MKDSEIQAEIASLIEHRVSEGQPVFAAWLIQSVVAAHPAMQGDDADFYTCCAYGHVSHCVRQALRRERADEERDETDLLLPGFKHLHRRYSVVREGEQVIVPIEVMTADELRAKAGEYKQMARGVMEHADELLRYAANRPQAVAA